MVRSRVLLSAVIAALAVGLAGCDETGVYPSTRLCRASLCRRVLRRAVLRRRLLWRRRLLRRVRLPWRRLSARRILPRWLWRYRGGYHGGYRGGYHGGGYHGGYHGGGPAALGRSGGGRMARASPALSRRSLIGLALADARSWGAASAAPCRREGDLSPLGFLDGLRGVRALRTARSTDSARRTTG